MSKLRKCVRFLPAFANLRYQRWMQNAFRNGSENTRIYILSEPGKVNDTISFYGWFGLEDLKSDNTHWVNVCTEKCDNIPGFRITQADPGF